MVAALKTCIWNFIVTTKLSWHRKALVLTAVGTSDKGYNKIDIFFMCFDILKPGFQL